MADLILAVTYFGILLGIGLIAASLLKKHHVPDSLFLLLIGLLLGPTVYTNPAVTEFISVHLVDVSLMGNIPDFLRLLALIMVVFSGTFHLGMKTFKKVGNLAVNLAFVGVVVNTLVMGIVANLVFGFDLVYSMLMSAVLSGTGSSVVFAFEDSLKKAKNALSVIKVESVLNSPLSVLLPIIFLDFVIMQPGAILEPMTYLSEFWVMIAVGVGAGLIIGLGISRILRGMLREYTPLMLFAIAMITYAMAENVGGSGMLAVGVCGLIAGAHLKGKDEDIQEFDDYLSEMLRISVFTLLGAQITLFIGLEEFLVVLGFFVIMVFLRPIFILPMLGKNRKRFTRPEFLLMSFVAPRGLPAAAMAPIVAGAIIAAGSEAVADQIMNIIFLVIMFSVAFSTGFAMLIRKKFEIVNGEGKRIIVNRKPEEHPDDEYVSVPEAGVEESGEQETKAQ